MSQFKKRSADGASKEAAKKEEAASKTLRLKIKNVSFAASDDDVRRWLEGIDVRSLDVPRRPNGKGRGHAVVAVASPEAEAKLLSRDGAALLGRAVEVRRFAEKPKRDGGGVEAPGVFGVKIRGRTVRLPFGAADPSLADASKEAINALDAFDATSVRAAAGREAARAVEVVHATTADGVDRGVASLRAKLAAGDGAVATADGGSFDVLGFDTETKPVFRKGQAPNTVCLVQLATRSLVVLFRLSRLAGAALPASLRALLEDPAILLVGVGCSGDEASLRKRCPDLDCGGTLFDLEKLAKSKYPSLRACGLRGLVGSCANMRLSKAQNTANWELAEYTPAMAKYAANDAAAGLFILDVLLAP